MRDIISVVMVIVVVCSAFYAGYTWGVAKTMAETEQEFKKIAMFVEKLLEKEVKGGGKNGK